MLLQASETSVTWRNKRLVGALRCHLAQLQTLPTTLLYLTFQTDQIISQPQAILLPYQLGQHHLHLRPGHYRHVLLFQKLAEQVVGASQSQDLPRIALNLLNKYLGYALMDLRPLPR
jgi:hypothetical protein